MNRKNMQSINSKHTFQRMLWYLFVSHILHDHRSAVLILATVADTSTTSLHYDLPPLHQTPPVRRFEVALPGDHIDTPACHSWFHRVRVA